MQKKMPLLSTHLGRNKGLMGRIGFFRIGGFGPRSGVEDLNCKTGTIGIGSTWFFGTGTTRSGTLSLQKVLLARYIEGSTTRGIDSVEVWQDPESGLTQKVDFPLPYRAPSPCSPGTRLVAPDKPVCWRDLALLLPSTSSDTFTVENNQFKNKSAVKLVLTNVYLMCLIIQWL